MGLSVLFAKQLPALLIASPLLLMSVSGAEAETYQNPEFGIYLDLPSGIHPCREMQHVHDHGPVMFLDPQDSQICGDFEHRRVIEIFAFYNVVEDAPTLKDFLKSQCRGPRPCLPAPEGLRIGDFKSEAYRVEHRGGWIDIDVLTQAVPMERRDPGNASAPWVNYSLELHTDKGHLNGDLVTFKSVLRAIELRPPTQ